MSVVPDASAAIAAGIREDGVVALHDATECGIIGAVYEMGQSSGLGVRLDKDKIVVAPGVREICGYFGLNPYSCISEGTLIIACRPHRAEAVLAALKGAGIAASIAGELTDPSKGMVLAENKQVKELRHPGTDRFWNVYYDALKKYQAQK
jgi:hydrogenase maturation factor